MLIVTQHITHMLYVSNELLNAKSFEVKSYMTEKSCGSHIVSGSGNQVSIELSNQTQTSEKQQNQES